MYAYCLQDYDGLWCYSLAAKTGFSVANIKNTNFLGIYLFFLIIVCVDSGILLFWGLIISRVGNICWLHGHRRRLVHYDDNSLSEVVGLSIVQFHLHVFFSGDRSREQGENLTWLWCWLLSKTRKKEVWKRNVLQDVSLNLKVKCAAEGRVSHFIWTYFCSLIMMTWCNSYYTVPCA